MLCDDGAIIADGSGAGTSPSTERSGPSSLGLPLVPPAQDVRYSVASPRLHAQARRCLPALRLRHFIHPFL
eukprot:4616176-Alexandrium_andersonii.AAC.1